MMNGYINGPMPLKANGKPHTNKDYYIQGRGAADQGIDIEDCPYIPTSTAEKQWKAGHRSAAR